MGRNYVRPTKEFGEPEEILKWSKETGNKNQSVRFLCIRAMMIEEGVKLEQIAKMFGVSTREVNRWVRLWNMGGKDALTIKKSPGRPRKFKEHHAARVKELVENQQELRSRLTIKGVYGLHKEEFQVDFCYEALCWQLKNMGISRITPRSKPMKQDIDRAEKFIELFNVLKKIHIPI